MTETNETKYRVRGPGMMTESLSILGTRGPLEPETTAVVVIDMINRCCTEGVGQLRSMAASNVDTSYYLSRIRDLVIPNLNELLGLCRRIGVQVFFVDGACYTEGFRDSIPQYAVNYKEWNAKVGSYETERVPGLVEAAGDVTLYKAGSGGYSSTLDVRLRNMGIKQAIYAGVATNGCVMLTVTAGFDLGYHGWFISDGTATISQRLQGISEELFSAYLARVVTTAEMMALLTEAARSGTGATSASERSRGQWG